MDSFVKNINGLPFRNATNGDKMAEENCRIGDPKGLAKYVHCESSLDG